MGESDELNYEEVIQQLITLRQEADSYRWEQGLLCCLLMERMSVKATDIAAELNYSAAQVRELAKTFSAFPNESMRVPFAELSWYHFRQAAKTDDPHYWLEQAADNAWSTREMQQAIKGAVLHDESREAQRLLDKVTRFIREGGVLNG